MLFVKAFQQHCLEKKIGNYILCITFYHPEKRPHLLRLQWREMCFDLIITVINLRNCRYQGLMKNPMFAEFFVLVWAVSFPSSTPCPWKHFWIVLLSYSSGPCLSAGTCDSQVHFSYNSPSHTDIDTVMKLGPVWWVLLRIRHIKVNITVCGGKKLRFFCFNFFHEEFYQK